MNAQISAALAAALAAGSITAQDAPKSSYQIELTAGFALTELDTSPEIEIRQFLLGGSYHLKPVALADHPWNEAAFLEHSTFVSAQVGYAEFEISSFDADGEVFGAGFRYAEKDTPVAAELAFSIGSLDGDAGLEIDLNEVSGRVGYWVKPNAIVGVSASFEEVEVQSALVNEVLRVGAFGKIVHDLGEDRAINVEADLGIASVDDGASEEENVELALASDFYFTPQYSAGALVALSFGDAVSEEGITFGLRGSAWFTPMFGGSVEVSRFNAEDSAGSDEDSLSIFASVRF